MPALLALAAACTFGVADFLGGLCTRKAAVVAITLTTNVAGALLAIVLVFTIDGEWTPKRSAGAPWQDSPDSSDWSCCIKDSPTDPTDSSVRSAPSSPRSCRSRWEFHSVTGRARSPSLDSLSLRSRSGSWLAVTSA